MQDQSGPRVNAYPSGYNHRAVKNLHWEGIFVHFRAGVCLLLPHNISITYVKRHRPLIGCTLYRYPYTSQTVRSYATEAASAGLRLTFAVPHQVHPSFFHFFFFPFFTDPTTAYHLSPNLFPTSFIDMQ